MYRWYQDLKVSRFVPRRLQQRRKGGMSRSGQLGMLCFADWLHILHAAFGTKKERRRRNRDRSWCGSEVSLYILCPAAVFLYKFFPTACRRGDIEQHYFYFKDEFLSLLRFFGGSQHLVQRRSKVEAWSSIFVVWKNYTTRRRRRKNGFQKTDEHFAHTRLSHTAERHPYRITLGRSIVYQEIDLFLCIG